MTDKSRILFGLLMCLLIAMAGQPSDDMTKEGIDSGSARARLASFGDTASYPETRLNSNFDATRVYDTMLKHLDDPHWYVSDPHPFLARVLPGVSFVAVPHGSWRTGSFLQGAVTCDGRFYQTVDLNSLLLDEGFSFDVTEMQTIAKVTVLLQYFASPPPQVDTATRRLKDRSPSPVSLGALAFPSVVFRSFTREVKKQPNGAEDTRLTVLCRINGMDETAAVDFNGTTDGRNSLEWFSARHKRLRYQPGRRVAPPPEQERPSTNVSVRGPASTISGHVFDAKTGEPLVGAAVFVAGTELDTVSDAEGRYTISHVQAGTYQLVASDIGFDDLEATVTLDGNKGLRVDFRLTWTPSMDNPRIIRQR